MANLFSMPEYLRIYLKLKENHHRATCPTENGMTGTKKVFWVNQAAITDHNHPIESKQDGIVKDANTEVDRFVYKGYPCMAFAVIGGRLSPELMVDFPRIM